MNLKEAVAKIRELEAKIKTLEGKARTRSQLEFSENQGSLTDFATVLKGRFDELEKTVESLSISGATFAKGGAFQAALTDSIKSLDEFTARGDLGAKAVEALAKDIEQFEKLTRLAGETTSNLAGDLSTQAALLNQLGLSYGEFSKNLDIAIYSFGMTASGVKNINLEIKELANQVNMLPATVSRNFQRVSQNLG